MSTTLGISAFDRFTIESAVNASRAYFLAKFGATIRSNIRVVVRATDGPVTAEATGTTITIFTLNQGWIIIRRAQRTKIVGHADPYPAN